MTANAPALILDKQINVRLNENSLLPLWLHNITGQSVENVQIDVVVVGAVPDLRIFPSGVNQSALPDGSIRRHSTAFRASHPGTYAVRVQISFKQQDGKKLHWECPDEISLTISSPDAQGQVNMTFNEPGLIKEYLPPGNYQFNAAMLVKLDPESAPGPTNAPVDVQSSLPPSEHCRRLSLIPVTEQGLGAEPELGLFAKNWRDSGRPMLELMRFVDRRGNPRGATVRVGDLYRIEIGSYRRGYITLITQGSSGRFFQLAPHQHWGKRILPPHAKAYFPDDILSNLSTRIEGQAPDPDYVTDDLPFQGVGCERALAIVSPQPVARDRKIFVNDGEVPDPITPAEVRTILLNLSKHADIELGYIEVEIVR